MTRELSNASIHKLFESVGRGIPDLDGHAIRVAERRILWSKLAQQTLADVGIPTQTPEQIAEWSRVQPGDELAPPPPTSQTEQQLAQLTQQLRTPTPAPTGVAHIRHPAPAARPRPAARPATPTSTIELPEMNIVGDPNEMLYTPGPNDPNYTGASKNVTSLLKVADFLSKKKSSKLEKVAAGKSYEQVLAAYQAKGGDEMRVGQKGRPDVTRGQYAAFLSSGSYLPANLPETMSVEIRAAIQNGRAVGVTVVTAPANGAFASQIDAAVRQIQFSPTSEKMDFTITKFPPAT